MQGTTCQKCQQGTMQGPTFASDSVRGERLLYRCSVCGYCADEPCKDKSDMEERKRVDQLVESVKMDAIARAKAKREADHA